MSEEKKVIEFLKKELPSWEERITVPMSSDCEVCVVIPAYCERDHILRPLGSLAYQKGVTPDQYEVIIVVNNPGKEPEKTRQQTENVFMRKLELYRKAVEENQEVLNLVKYINGEDGKVKLTGQEREILEEIKQSGLKVFALDKSSPGKTLADAEANVGGARNRGLAEAVARFYEYNGRNGIVAHTDADTRVDRDYILNLIKTFREKPGLVGLVGHRFGELIDEFDAATRKAFSNYSGLFNYERLFEILANERDLLGQENAANVFLVGQNMANRAFEGAVIGGVPRLAGGEDVAFGKKLAQVGMIEFNESIRTSSAIRNSPRAVESAGSGMIKCSEDIEERGTIEVANPEKALIIKHVKRKMNKVLKNRQLTPETLFHILSIVDPCLINREDLLLLSRRLPETADIDKIEPHSRIGLILNRIYEGIKCEDRMELKEACSEIIKIFCFHEEYKKKYEYNKKLVLKKIEIREKIVEALLAVIFAEQNRNFNSEGLLEIIKSVTKKMELYEEFLFDLANSNFVIEKLSKIIAKAETKQAAMDLIRINFPVLLITPPENSIEFKSVELEVMRDVVLSPV